MWVGTCVQLKMNKPSIVCIDNFLQQHDCLFPSPWRFFGCIHSGFCVISVQALLPPLTELFLCTNRPRAVPDGPNSSIWQVLWLTQPPFVSRVCFSQHWRQEGKILDELFVCNFSESSLIRKKKKNPLKNILVVLFVPPRWRHTAVLRREKCCRPLFTPRLPVKVPD